MFVVTIMSLTIFSSRLVVDQCQKGWSMTMFAMTTTILRTDDDDSDMADDDSYIFSGLPYHNCCTPFSSFSRTKLCLIPHFFHCDYWHRTFFSCAITIIHATVKSDPVELMIAELLMGKWRWCDEEEVKTGTCALGSANTVRFMALMIITDDDDWR